jgi:hypothetical protein
VGWSACGGESNIVLWLGDVADGEAAPPSAFEGGVVGEGSPAASPGVVGVGTGMSSRLTRSVTTGIYIIVICSSEAGMTSIPAISNDMILSGDQMNPRPVASSRSKFTARNESSVKVGDVGKPAIHTTMMKQQKARHVIHDFDSGPQMIGTGRDIKTGDRGTVCPKMWAKGRCCACMCGGRGGKPIGRGEYGAIV